MSQETTKPKTHEKSMGAQPKAPGPHYRTETKDRGWGTLDVKKQNQEKEKRVECINKKIRGTTIRARTGKISFAQAAGQPHEKKKIIIYYSEKNKGQKPKGNLGTEAPGLQSKGGAKKERHSIPPKKEGDYT